VDKKIEENNKVVMLDSSLQPSWEQLVINIIVKKHSQLQQDNCIPIRGRVLEEATRMFILE
jgi:hypothetical protein